MADQGRDSLGPIHGFSGQTQKGSSLGGLMVLRPLSDSLLGRLSASRCFTQRLAQNKARCSRTARSDSRLPAPRRTARLRARVRRHEEFPGGDRPVSLNSASSASLVEQECNRVLPLQQHRAPLTASNPEHERGRNPSRPAPATHPRRKDLPTSPSRAIDIRHQAHSASASSCRAGVQQRAARRLTIAINGT
jgi:hypothetical protein